MGEMAVGRLRKLLGAILATMVAATSSAQAGLFKDLGLGLTVAGFNFQGQRIPGIGTDISTFTQFPGNTLDFGVGALSLSGPVSLEVFTGGRSLSTLKIRFQTALRSENASQPLAYNFVYDVGGQQTTVNGSLLVDGALSLNRLGYYDLDLTYSSRQDVSRDGQIVTSDQSFDSDIGPIHIRGNVLADAFALLTTPILGSDPGRNPFLSLSGAATLKTVLRDRADPFLDNASLAALVDPAFTFDRGALDGQAFFQPLAQGDVFAQGAFAEGSGAARLVVPEPAVLALMIAGLPFLFRRRRMIHT